jgi:hypothetical protein
MLNYSVAELRIIKLGARDKANEIISYLRTEYPKRKALMEELDKV